MGVNESRMLLAVLALAATLDVADLDRLTVYEKAWDDSATEKEPEARDAFAGRAGDLVDHFLRRNEGRPRTGAYAFVLRALADVDSTITLVGALREPPEPAPGAVRRQPSEIAALLGTIVDAPAVGADPRLAAALGELVAVPGDTKNSELVRAAGVALLGRCRSPEALKALLARFDDPETRLRFMAVQAVGWMGERIAAADRAAVLAAVAARLEKDEDSEVRFHAAEAIRHLELREGAGVLDAALENERAPQVVDAIVEALEALGAPVTDPARCREIAGRGFEANEMRPLFERWRAVATQGELVGAASDGPPTLRALALRALVVDPAPPPEGTPIGEAPPPPARPIDGIDDHDTIERLLASAVDVLGRDGALSTHDAAIEATWGLARGNLERILPKTDAIEPLPLRYLASWSLHRWSGAAYDDYRRTREILAAVWLALPFVLVAFVAPPARPFAMAGLLAVAGWGATTYLSRGPLDLPPWPYPLAKVRFLVAIAGLVTAWIILRVPNRTRLVAILGGGALFLASYVATRATGFFPPDTLDGWLFLMEPALGVSLTAPVAWVLAKAAERIGRFRPAGGRLVH